eukprot:TRINITY_DN51090_c0_g2_i1.p1 TRINITY_DN51090_c0_g2~~TRINITY_DN51090_c0_g2_i1.p1  ORF type:complete len:399 (-),score=103.10 TRINITY_DN51090_c0_g2_i1:145-1341(-)
MNAFKRPHTSANGNETSSSKKRKKRNKGKDRGDEGTQTPLRALPPLLSYGIELYEQTTPCTPPRLADELRRRDVVGELKEQLLRMCGKGKPTVRYPSLGFERWVLASSVLPPKEGSTADPLIPVHGVVEQGLEQDLIKVGYPRARAREIAQTMAEQALVLVGKQWGSPKCPERVDFKRSGDGVVLSCSDLKRKRLAFTLHDTVYKKLAILYHHSQGANKQSSEAKAACHLAMFKCCLRYDTLSGPGFQIAVNHSEFAQLGECVEVFASPFNCIGRVYGSAFADTDSCFGSLGSAFRWFGAAMEQCVRLEANPPFVPQVLEAFVDLIVETRASKGVLSVVVPVWKDAPYYKKLLGLGAKRTLSDEWIQPNPSALIVRKIPTPCELFTIQLQGDSVLSSP